MRIGRDLVAQRILALLRSPHLGIGEEEPLVAAGPPVPLGELAGSRALAEEMLTAAPLSVDDIAIRLGYAEATPFIHAFKRWTGLTPAAYRRAHHRP